MPTNLSKKSQYLLGIIWFLFHLVISNGNDVIGKHLGENLHAIQITFLRFLFGTISLLPFMFYHKAYAFKTKHIGMHAVRGLLLFGGIALWVYGIGRVRLSTATVINFTIPFFILLLAKVFLKEHVGWSRWVATVIGFGGILFILNPGQLAFDPMTLMLLLASVMFASLDILNKRFVVEETMLSMLFYVALFTSLFGLIPTIWVWTSPSMFQLFLLFSLGAGANIVLFCLLKGFFYADASALAPFRYMELILSAATGYLFFAEVPAISTLLGAAIIIPSALFIVRYELKHS